MARRDFGSRDKAFVDQEVFKTVKPFLIVRTGKINVGRQHFPIKARGVDVEGTGRAHRAHHGEYAAFPSRVKHRFIGFDFDLAEPVHAAHVVDAVHDGHPGVLAKPVPIIESRVTSSASCSSLQPLVPSGRIGNTRKRVSAVESHTLISVSFGKVTPKSASTPRGSLMARER